MDSYSGILDANGLTYTPVTYYWQVGSIKKPFSCILHVSVITSQLPELLFVIVPVLIEQQVPFQIIRDLHTAHALLDGSLGYTHLGKLVCIYPQDNQQALSLAQKLLLLTPAFRGPRIPGNHHLGTVIYTQYSTANPWPFDTITPPSAPKTRRLLNNVYYPFAVLKPHAKGDVLKAVYFKKIWLIRLCLIKQGRLNMFADGFGRDIRDRLLWQYQLFRELAGTLPLPEIFDHFQQEEDSYLSMEFIKGTSLTAWIDRLYQQRCWTDLPPALQEQLLTRLEEVLTIIGLLHEKGYVHRDLTPDNFLINKKGRLFLIDLELTWSTNSGQPDPPFRLGTPGYLSPEQQDTRRPTPKEDIYAFGSLILVFFTNLTPLKFNDQALALVKEKISFFTGDSPIGELILQCWDANPIQRPNLSAIQQTLGQCRRQLKHTVRPAEVTIENIWGTIQAGLHGLSLPQLLSPKGRWMSRIQPKQDQLSSPTLELTISEGWHTGMSGPLWLIARAKNAGFDITSCQAPYIHSWEYLQQHSCKNPAGLPPGLYTGGAGIALAMVEGLHSGLLSPGHETDSQLEQCLSRTAAQPGLSNGWAGQGIALLQATPWLKNNLAEFLLQSCITNLMNKSKSWGPDHSWDTGTAGITWFLLTYLQLYPDNHIIKAITRTLQGLIRRDQHIGPDILLVLIKAHEVLKTPSYREIVERRLYRFPPRPVKRDFTLATGLAGLGELYLEAYRVFQEKEWQTRATWIAQVLANTFKETQEGTGHWVTDLHYPITADLFTGNSGILHFLIRYGSPTTCTHPLSPAISH